MPRLEERETSKELGKSQLWLVLQPATWADLLAQQFAKPYIWWCLQSKFGECGMARKPTKLDFRPRIWSKLGVTWRDLVTHSIWSFSEMSCFEVILQKWVCLVFFFRWCEHVSDLLLERIKQRKRKGPSGPEGLLRPSSLIAHLMEITPITVAAA